MEWTWLKFSVTQCSQGWVSCTARYTATVYFGTTNMFMYCGGTCACAECRVVCVVAFVLGG